MEPLLPVVLQTFRDTWIVVGLVIITIPAVYLTLNEVRSIFVNSTPNDADGMSVIITGVLVPGGPMALKQMVKNIASSGKVLPVKEASSHRNRIKP
jgi:hypothetical protein